MPRKLPTHYISPSAVSITPNANGSQNDLAVYVAKGAKIKVYLPAAGIDMQNAAFQEWTFSGRNRRLAESGKPYTIYARLSIDNKSDGYLVFAAQVKDGGVWYDKYGSHKTSESPEDIQVYSLAKGKEDECYVSLTGGYYYVRLGWVTLPDDGKRSVEFDTGILGTDQYNAEWSLDPDSSSLRVELTGSIDGEDAGERPYVPWGKTLNLQAKLVEGWYTGDAGAVDQWTIVRDTGDEEADAAWNQGPSAQAFMESGNILFEHQEGGTDDFNNAVAAVFTVTAWKKEEVSSDSGEESGQPAYTALASNSMTVVTEASEYISKLKDDTAAGVITFLKGLVSRGDVVVNGLLTAYNAVMNTIKSSNYTGDGVTDSGWSITNDYAGSSRLVVDYLYARKKAVFESLEIKELQFTSGDLAQSLASATIERTDYLQVDEQGDETILGYSDRKIPWTLKGFLMRLSSSKPYALARNKKIRINLKPEDLQNVNRVRCYFLAKDDNKKIFNLWKVNDLARCQTFNIDNIDRETYAGETHKAGNVYWWRLVKKISKGAVTVDGKEYHYFDVAYGFDAEQEANRTGVRTSWCDILSDLPAAGDKVVQFGNTEAPARMNIIVSEVNGEGNIDAPSIKSYRGVHTFNTDDCWWGGESCRKMMLSPSSGVEFYAPSFKFITEYGIERTQVERGAWLAIPFEEDTEHETFPDYSDDILDENGNFVSRSDGSPKKYVRKCRYYDRVEHKGSTWLCTIAESHYWRKYDNGVWSKITEAQYKALPQEEKDKCEEVRNYTTDEPSKASNDWTVSAERGQDGSFKSRVFCRTNINIKNANVRGGSYDNPIPTLTKIGDDVVEITWEDGVPQGTEMLWSTVCTFYGDGSNSGWSKPSQETDTETLDIEFSPEATRPDVPVGTAANRNTQETIEARQEQGWYDPSRLPADQQMIYRAECKIKNGVYEMKDGNPAWVIARIKGEKGTSVREVKPYYAKQSPESYNGNPPQDGWEESIAALGTIAEGWYVWTKNVISFTDNVESTTTYTVSKWGIDGDGIENIETKFYENSLLLTQRQLEGKDPVSGTTYVTESDWKEYGQLALTKGDYIYTRTKITYDKSDTPTISYQVNRLGQDGVGYVATEEYYVLGNSQTDVPTGHPYTGNQPYKKYTAAEWQQIQITGGWSESRPTYQGDANKYLWNFEVSFDTDGNAMVTRPICIGNYAKGIVSIVESYAISASDVAPQAGSYPSDIETWTDEAHDCAPTDAKPYQWNKTVTSYSDGTSDTFYHVSAVKGTRGRGITNTNIYYKADTTTPATPSGAPAQSGWSDNGNDLITDANANKHLYESTCTTYSDGTYSWTTPIDDGLIKDMAEMSEEFALSDSGTTAPTTGWSTSVTPTAGKWVWSRTVLTFKNGNKKYVNTQCVGYCGIDGKNAVRLDIDNEMDAVQTDSTGVVTAARTVYTVVHLYDGSTEVNMSTASLTTDGNKEKSGNGIKVSWSFSVGDNGTDMEKTIKYVYKGVEYSAVFSIVMSNGQAIYQLKPSMSAIPFQRNADNTLTPASREVGLSIVKIDGGSSQEITSGWVDMNLYVRYSTSSMPASMSDGTVWRSGTVSVPNTANNLYIALFNSSNVLLDRESIPVIKDGEKGTSTEHVSVYKAQSDKPTKPTGTVVPPSGWSKVPVEGSASVALTYTYTGSWTQSGNVLTSNTIGNDGITKERVSFTSTGSVTIKVRLTASSEANYDFILIGYPDVDNVTRTSNYMQRVSGSNSVEVELNFSGAGSHFFVVAYAKDSSSTSGSDNGQFEILGAYESIAIPIWVSTSKLVNDVCDGNWSDPVRWNGKDGEAGKNGKDAAVAVFSRNPIVFQGSSLGSSVNTNSISSLIRVLDGGTEYTPTNINVGSKPSGVTVTASSSGQVSVSPSQTGLSEDMLTGSIKLTLTYNGGKTVVGYLTTTVARAGEDASYDFITLHGTCHDGSSSAKGFITVQKDGTKTSMDTLGRGLTFFAVNRETLQIVTSGTLSPSLYDTYGDSGACNSLAAKIRSCNNSYFVCLVSHDAIGWNENLVSAIREYGGMTPEKTDTSRYPFVFIGVKGLSQGYALQQQGEFQSTLGAQVTAYVNDSMFSSVKQGHMGRNFYYDGVYDSSKSYKVTQYEAPFVSYNSNYWVRIGDDGTTATGQAPSTTSPYWALMTSTFKYLITEAIFSEYAKLGSWIFNGDYMFSSKDANGNTRGSQSYTGMSDTQKTSGFIPAVAMDAANGRASFSGDKVRFNPDGSGWLANKNIKWGEAGDAEFMGTIKAGSTTIVGNLNITDATHGLTLFDADSVPRVNLQPGDITNYNSVSGGTIENKPISGSGPYSVNLGYVGVGKSVHVAYMAFTTSTRNPYISNVSVSVYFGNNIVKTFTLTGWTYNNYTVVRDRSVRGCEFIIDNNTGSSQNVTISFSVTASYPSYITMFNACYQIGERTNTYIGRNGMVSQQLPNQYMWLDRAHGFEVRKDLCGLRIGVHSYMNTDIAGSMIDVIAGARGASPNYKPIWLPAYNFVPMFSPGAYINKKISNVSDEYRYTYAIQPGSDRGICNVIMAGGSSFNEDVWILLPNPDSIQDVDGNTCSLPTGYMITIINNTEHSVYVTGDTNLHKTIIYDAHRDRNYYADINGAQARDTYIYEGYFNGEYHWLSMHDTQ